MSNLRAQRTLAAPARVSGFGYWSSLDVCLEFRPAPPHAGVVFVRGDLPGAPRVPADVSRRIDVPRRTNLAAGPARVEMVEHVMAALAGLRIDNCEVWCDRGEMPGPDGSSRLFVDALQRAGVVEQDARRPRLVVAETTRVEADGAWVQAEPHDGLRIEYHLDYGPAGPIGRQRFDAEIDEQVFVDELASARTFILEAEAEWLRTQGLALRATYADLLVFDSHGPKDNRLRFDDECVRHKALDLIGDLALGGCDVVGKFSASRSGHRLNAVLLRRLLEARRQAA